MSLCVLTVNRILNDALQTCLYGEVIDYISDEDINFLGGAIRSCVWLPENNIRGKVHTYYYVVIGPYAVIRIRTDDGQMSKTIMVRYSKEYLPKFEKYR